MATLQIQIDDALKRDADNLFLSLGLDTSTAMRIFLNAAVDYGGFPFPVARRVSGDSLWQAVEDTRKRRNLFGPFDSAEEAVASMLDSTKEAMTSLLDSAEDAMASTLDSAEKAMASVLED